MFKKLIISSFALFFQAFLWAEIREIDRFDALLQELDPKALMFLDIDETLIETPIMLGGKAWRRYAGQVLAKAKAPEQAIQTQDKLTYFIAKRTSYVSIEKSAHACVKAFQDNKMSVFCLTARGREHWYDMPAVDAEEFTVNHLKQAGFDFSSFNALKNDPLFSHRSYARGIFFAYPIEDKGELILELFAGTDFRPAKVVFVDDKIDNIRSVESALEKLEIPSISFYYTHIDKYREFDALTSYIQLEKLFFEGQILSDGEASAFKGDYADKNPDELFLAFITRIEEAI